MSLFARSPPWSLILPSRFNFLSLSLVLISIAVPQASQAQSTSTPEAAAMPHTQDRSEQSFSVGTFLWMTLRDPVHGTEQGTTRNAGASFSYHQQFRPLLGYKANFSWTKTGEVYGGLTNQQSGADIPTKVYEVSTTYVVQQPQNSSHWRAFAELGPGLLIFVPSGYPFAGHTNYQAAAVYGAGATYQPGKRFGAQLEYRGCFYDNPSFATGYVNFNANKFPTFTAGPAVSFTYRFR